MNERIGELLVKENLLSTEQLQKARAEAASKGERLGAQITKLGFLEEDELTDFVASVTGGEVDANLTVCIDGIGAGLRQAANAPTQPRGIAEQAQSRYCYR